MSFIRYTRAAAGVVRSTSFFAELLETRRLLSTEIVPFPGPGTVPFMAANFSFNDVSFALQPESTTNVRTLEFLTTGYQPSLLPAWKYDPAGGGIGFFNWPSVKTIERDGPARSEFGTAYAGLIGNVSRTQEVSTETAERLMADIVTAHESSGYTTTRAPFDASVTWEAKGGGMDGKRVTLKGLAAQFRAVSESDAQGQNEGTSLTYVLPAGYSPTGFAQFYLVDITATATIATTDPDVIPLGEIAATFLGTSGPEAYDSLQLAAIAPTVKFTGAIPDTLFLYDFSTEATIAPGHMPYVNEFEQTALMFGGGDACGPSSLTMALEEVGIFVPVVTVYDGTMRLPPQTPHGFDWEKGKAFASGMTLHSAVYKEYDRWSAIDANLDAGRPVVLANHLGIESADGPGHVILVLATGRDPRVMAGLHELDASNGGEYYIVADPAGHYFANPGQGGENVGHYGKVQPLRARAFGLNYGGWFAIYPKEKLRQKTEAFDGKKTVIRTLTLDAREPVIDATVHSPVTIVITDPLGRKTGIQPDGTILEGVPDSEYHVAAIDDEIGQAVHYLPELGKTVLIGNPIPGTYTAELVGTGAGTFTLDVDFLRPGEANSRFTVTGTVIEGEHKLYPFTFPPAAAPAVTQVYVSASAWSSAFKQSVAALNSGGLPLGFAVPAQGQLDDLPWTNLNQISITFSQNIQVNAGDLKIRGARVPDYDLDATAFTYDATSKTATWKLAGATTFGNDRILLDLNAAGPDGVKSIDGTFLDGDWINPAGVAAGGDAYPSGDGSPGGDFRFRINVLPGDADRSGTVLANDFSQVKQKFFTSTTNRGSGPAAYSVFHDVNGSGAILADDFSAVKSRFFNTLPGGEPAATMPLSAASAAAMRPTRPPARSRLVAELLV